jgi:beta-galactosidase
MTFGHGGKVDISGIAPQERKVITIDAMKQVIERVLGHHGDQEIFVIFQFKTREAQPLIDKGQIVARQQFVLNPYQFPKISEYSENSDYSEKKTHSCAPTSRHQLHRTHAAPHLQRADCGQSLRCLHARRRWPSR